MKREIGSTLLRIIELSSILNLSQNTTEMMARRLENTQNSKETLLKAKGLLTILEESKTEEAVLKKLGEAQ